MPVKSPPRVYDTQNMYKRKTVSYGYPHDLTLPNGTVITFESNALKNFKRVDERNLIFCKHLNLEQCSVNILDTVHLRGLRVLILSYQSITVLDTRFLVSLEYLDISGTSITELQTVGLVKL